jgi:hypothetical protein
MTFRTLHTLEARGNILLEVVKDRFGAGDSAMRRLIWRTAAELTHMLERRGVRYSELKPALVPQITKSEVALFFDRASIESAAYGWQVHARILPLLNLASSHSTLHGDLSGETAPHDWIRTALEIHLESSGNPFSMVSSNQIYCAYLNNVSPHFRRRPHDTLKLTDRTSAMLTRPTPRSSKHT